MASVEATSSRLFRVRRTVTKMLIDRGYFVPEQLANMSKEQFVEKYGEHPARDSLFLLVPKRDDPTDQIFVFFPEEAKPGVKSMKTYFKRMKDESVRRAIIVVQQQLTSFARQGLNELGSKGFRIEIFMETELVVNITDHVLVPRHVPLTDTEKKELLERYKMKESQLPRIQLGDPVARYFGLTRGNVVKIIRPSETAGRYVTYRLVV